MFTITALSTLGVVGLVGFVGSWNMARYLYKAHIVNNSIYTVCASCKIKTKIESEYSFNKIGFTP